MRHETPISSGFHAFSDYHSNELHRIFPDSLGALSVGELNSPRVAPLPTPDSRFPIPDSRLPRCAFRWRIKFATGRTAPDSRFPIPDSRFPIPDSRSPPGRG
ncbi:MAG: hypothetical protein F6K63_32470 [Moorea sp. SIO1G6]|uniref:hypothetical protein n=1 Tax=Moorena sp. SIO1G6 TaxID=2607840 RepID=UPI0013C0B023|nr:hypothetical protein [Moorena sp. SIO1G6]NET68855.1 hypothetical protein [Moorena sp. SIO1G6]